MMLGPVMLWALYLGVTSSGAQKTLCSTEDQNGVSCIQGKGLIPVLCFWYEMSTFGCNPLSSNHISSIFSFCLSGQLC